MTELDTAAVGGAWRYERKFVPVGRSRHELEAIIALHPAAFSEIHRERWVNNVYLDTLDRACYAEAVAGQSVRRKIRLRWYGPVRAAADGLVLEIKHKRGALGRKDSYRLPGPDPADGCSSEALAACVDAVRLPAELRLSFGLLRPTLVNRYRRKYFLSADGALRLTLDWDVRQCRAGRSAGRLATGRPQRDRLVLELKYDAAADELARELAACFPFRLTRNSKYVNGLDES